MNQPQCQLPELQPPATTNHKHSHETQYWAQKVDHVQRPDHILLDDYAQTYIRHYYVDMKVLLICSTHTQTFQNFFSFLVHVESFGSWKFCDVLWFLLDALRLFILLPIPRQIPWNSSTKQILNNVYSKVENKGDKKHGMFTFHQSTWPCTLAWAASVSLCCTASNMRRRPSTSNMTTSSSNSKAPAPKNKTCVQQH